VNQNKLEMKFTKEEISLCRQVAKKHRLKIEYGDWYWSSAYPKILLAMDYGFKPTEQEFAGVFKIWTISDCLEFLNKHGWNAVTLSWRMEQIGDKPEIAYCEIIHDNFYEAEEKKALNHVKDFETKTLFAACLKAVLAVLEEKSK